MKALRFRAQLEEAKLEFERREFVFQSFDLARRSTNSSAVVDRFRSRSRCDFSRSEMKRRQSPTTSPWAPPPKKTRNPPRLVSERLFQIPHGSFAVSSTAQRSAAETRTAVVRV